jgi:hypothetical protein
VVVHISNPSYEEAIGARTTVQVILGKDLRPYLKTKTKQKKLEV